jgi:Domain of unknown function (DUF4234)
MAYEMQIRESGDRVKVRSPWAAALLPLITLGIYHLVWWYRINRELRDYGKAKGYDLGQNPTNSLLALFPGGIIIVPALITYWRGTKRVMGASKIAGQPPLNGWIAIILYVLNKVWEAEADPVSGELAPPAPADAMPPPLPEQPPATEPPAADPPPAGPTA